MASVANEKYGGCAGCLVGWIQNMDQPEIHVGNHRNVISFVFWGPASSGEPISCLTFLLSYFLFLFKSSTVIDIFFICSYPLPLLFLFFSTVVTVANVYYVYYTTSAASLPGPNTPAPSATNASFRSSHYSNSSGTSFASRNSSSRPHS